MTEVVLVIQPEIETTYITQPGIPGPPGPPGPPGGGSLTLTAAIDLSGHRVVVATPSGATYAEPTNPAHADAVVGLTLGAALTGSPVTVQAAGEVTEPSWNWTAGAVLYVGDGGVLSASPPSAGWVQPFAVALAPTKIFLLQRHAILR